MKASEYALLAALAGAEARVGGVDIGVVEHAAAADVAPGVAAAARLLQRAVWRAHHPSHRLVG